MMYKKKAKAIYDLNIIILWKKKEKKKGNIIA